MGINDDSDEIINIINYLEENNTDINFHDAKTQNFYNRFRNIEKKVQMSKMLIGSKTEVQKMIEKVESIKIEERPDWLDYYKNEDDEDETNVNGKPTSDRDKNLGQDIIDRLTNEIKEKIENEPGMTLDEIRIEINDEMNVMNTIRQGFGMTNEMLEQLRDAPDITEEQINEIRNNN
jgi:TPP-dependent 2-oxoacid decarboxylase